MSRSPLDAIRRPEYVGERRCWPCTYLNAAIVLALAVATAVVSLPLALVVAAGGAALIALRGYVIPGTPRFGPVVGRYLPVEFRHGPGGRPAADGAAGPGPGSSAGADGGADARAAPADGPDSLGDAGAGTDDEDATADAAAPTDGEAMVEALLDAGVLVADGEALAVADWFADAWRAELAALRDLDDAGLAAAAAEAAPVDVEGGVSDDGRWITLTGARTVWLLRVQALADVAAVRAMADTDVPPATRAAAAEPLRMFVPECPTTGGPIEETTVANCCGGTSSVYSTPEQHVLACVDTGEVVHAFDEA